MKIGLIGCGKMGSALLQGILAAKPDMFETAVVHDAYAPVMTALAESNQLIETAPSNRAVAGVADVVLLCVKPQQCSEVAQELAEASRALLCISVAAGVTIETLERHLGGEQRLIRVMPNTPALVGAGAAGYALGTRATDEDAVLTKELLSSVGVAHQVSETLLDAVTGVSGSGPAYLYLVIEAMADAGVLNGLPRPVALELAAQTVIGAGKMVLETGLHPGVLKDQVTSPGGTTIRALASLERDGLRSAMIRAVNAAAERSQAMRQ